MLLFFSSISNSTDTTYTNEGTLKKNRKLTEKQKKNMFYENNIEIINKLTNS